MCNSAYTTKSHLYKHARKTHGIQTDDYKRILVSNSEVGLHGKSPRSNSNMEEIFVKEGIELFSDEELEKALSLERTKW